MKTKKRLLVGLSSLAVAMLDKVFPGTAGTVVAAVGIVLLAMELDIVLSSLMKEAGEERRKSRS
mgnify:CR=1 FL=1